MDCFSFLALVKQVFPHLDFMGWYSLGITPNESDLKIHEQVNNFKWKEGKENNEC